LLAGEYRAAELALGERHNRRGGTMLGSSSNAELDGASGCATRCDALNEAGIDAADRHRRRWRRDARCAVRSTRPRACPCRAPGTIENDICGTDQSHRRRHGAQHGARRHGPHPRHGVVAGAGFVIEMMGEKSGYLALMTGSRAAQMVCIPEEPFTSRRM
jgi:6-phosphofructokinase